MNIEIPSYVSTLMHKLNESGYECFIVGGAIRSILLNLPVHDYDLTTNATPIEMREAFKGFHTIETGLQHGTLTVVNEHVPVEITTYRKDSTYEDHRHPDEVIFTTSIKDDCSRRDFTINAFCYNEKDGLLDFFDGKKDLENKVIKCIGDPYKRFEEDALRILRAIRFASQLDFSIEENTSKAVINKQETLSYVSIERIHEEFVKFLEGKGFLQLLYPYRKVFSVFLQDLNNMNTEWDTLIERYKWSKPNHLIRMAILLTCECFENPKSILEQLKYSNDEKKQILNMIQLKDVPLNNRIDTRHLLNQLCCDFDLYINYRESIDCKEYPTVKDIYDSIVLEGDCYSLKQLDINGDDMLELGYNGKQIKEKLDYLLNSVMDSKVNNDKKDLIEYINQTNN